MSDDERRYLEQFCAALDGDFNTLPIGIPGRIAEFMAEALARHDWNQQFNRAASNAAIYFVEVPMSEPETPSLPPSAPSVQPGLTNEQMARLQANGLSPSAPSVPAAMTAEEWAKRKAQRDEVWAEIEEDGGVSVYVWPSADWNPHDAAPVALRHALAALCLYGQPFGFRQEDAALVKRIADECDGTLTDDDSERVFADDVRLTMGDVRRLWSLASRIAALLPPQPPTENAPNE